ncbi:MAG: NADH-quinone oxidoreductase subunit G, partial [Propionibacterium sp.]
EESTGSFLNWEHRLRQVNRATKADRSPMTELRILAALADAMGKPLGFRSPGGAWEDYAELGSWVGPRATFAPTPIPKVAAGMKLASWRLLLDDSACMAGEENLAKTAPKAVVKISANNAEQLGETAIVAGPAGEIELPVEVTDIPDDVVWLPGHSGFNLNMVIGVQPGAEVELRGGTK